MRPTGNSRRRRGVSAWKSQSSWLVCYYSDWYRVTVELPLLLHIQFFSLGITRDRAKRLTRDTVQKMDSTNDLSNTVQAENKHLEIDLRSTTVSPSYDPSCAIFSSFNFMVIFNIASADIAESQTYFMVLTQKV